MHLQTHRSSFFFSLAVLSALLFPGSTLEAQANRFQLQPYTAPDGSASAGVPPGWHVIQAADTVIVMDGPQNERIFLGKTFVARNGPFQPGQQPGGGIDLTMPYAANLAQKFQMLIVFSSAANGVQAQVRINSAIPIQVPAPLGQCGRFIADLGGGPNGPMKSEAFLCSLPLDAGGVYKSIFKLAQAPPAVAARERALAEAVFASYRVAPGMLQRKLAPFTQPVAVNPNAGDVVATGVPASPSGQPAMDPECYDLILIRETPQDQLPAKCR